MINYWAVLVAAVICFALGAAWYSPAVFGKQWGAAHGLTLERMAGMKGRMLPALMVSFISYLVAGYVVARVLGWSGRTGIGGGLEIALTLWFAFTLFEQLVSHLYSDRKNTVLLVDAGFRLATMVVIGLIVGGWR